MIENITHEGQFMALIVRSHFNEPGIHFFTDNDLSQQLAFMKHPAKKVIMPHVHREVHRQVSLTQEVLILRKGSLRVDFYSNDQEYLFSRVLNAGDVILLATGGHGFEVLEDLEMFEIKQGPYAGDKDKVRFEATPHTLKMT